MALTRSLTAAAAAELVSLASFVPAALAWEPKEPVDFVIMAGEGGGADQMARLMQAIIDESQF